MVQRRAAPDAARASLPLRSLIARCLARDPSERIGSAEELLEAIERLRRPPERRPVDGGNPYRGLGVFDERHERLFFGRAADIDALAERLRRASVLFVAGDSGIGKSSLCRAGVPPELARVRLEGRAVWVTLTTSPGSHPLRSLAATLAPFVDAPQETLLERLRDEPTTVLADLGRRHDEDGMLLVIDQLEELLTTSLAEEVQPFSDWLSGVALGWPGLRVIATVRSDFLTRLAELPGLGDVIAKSLFLLRPLSRAQLRAVVVGPAEVNEVRFESETMIEELVDAASEGQGALPLLQFTLARLWEARDVATRTIPRAALEGLGGLSGSLSRHADEVVDGLRPAAQRMVRDVLVSLVGPDRTRTVRTEAELRLDDPDRAEVVESLVQGRLLVALEDVDGRAFQLAHDVLIRTWPRLRGWLAQDTEAQLALDHLARAARDWVRLGRRREDLWSGPQLRRLARALQGRPLPTVSQQFWMASRRAVFLRRLRWGVLSILATTAAGGLVIGTTLEAERKIAARVRHLEDRATWALIEARSSEARVEEDHRALTESLAAGRRETAEEHWRRVQAGRKTADRLRRQALASLEGALVLRPAAKNLRASFADALVGRLRLARAARDERLAVELFERLALYDDGGLRRAELERPGRVDIEGRVDASLRFFRAVRTPTGRRTERAIPLDRDRSLPPGRYMVEVSLPAQAPVRQTLRIDPGQTAELRLADLVPVRPPPEGMVWVPAGVSTMGSADEDDSRIGFFDAPPLHRARIDGFFIAETEVTFGDYLTFLDALPPEARSAAMPGADGTGGGSLSLRRQRGVWRLHIRPVETEYRAAAGERIRFPGRDRRAEQNWLRWPVLGVSAEQALAYVRWLDASKRVPGARLCTEREWMRAARGPDTRRFPHGDHLETDDANFDLTYGRDPEGMGPDEVGSHPASRSPFGVDDMTGNAFEWTVSSYQPDAFVLRGGSYFYDGKTNRLCNRAVAVRSARLTSSGIRVCATP